MYFKRNLHALLILGMFAVHGSAAGYQFVNIADSRGSFEGFEFTSQAVSDTGRVAFIGYQGGVPGSYVGDGIMTNMIAPDLSSPAGFRLLGRFALNESGVAAANIERCCSPREGKIQLYEASGTRNLSELASSATFERGFTFPAINNSGAVAFGIRTYEWATAISQNSITRWSAGISETVLGTSAGFTFLGSTGLNELGEVAFQGFKDGEGWSYHRTDGTTISPIADSTGPLNISSQSIARTAINDSGAVAFWTQLDAGGEGIFVGDGGPLTTVVTADPTTPFYALDADIDMNNQGTVAFFAELWDGRNGIFTGPDLVNDKVVAHGDLLFGQFVTGLGRPHLNEQGDIAFWFLVRDPREPEREWTGIALAVKQSPLVGDYNGDGTVDAADYVVWRKNDGTQEGYDTWRSNFGATIGSGAGANDSANAAVPEPTCRWMLVTGMLAVFFRRRAIACAGFNSA